MKNVPNSSLKGILIVDKPSGITSHDVVDKVRRSFRIKRVGHAGTLDPLATGVLVVLIGQATKLFSKFSYFDKSYEATITLGISTDTSDIQGKITKQGNCNMVTLSRLKEVVETFTGEVDQVPPMVSAVKVDGRRLYELARKGIEVDRKPRRIKIFSLNILDFSLPFIKISLQCSKGTYVRKIAEDIGDRLGCGGCISKIHRTQVGPFRIEQAISLDEIKREDIIAVEKFL